MIDITYNPSLVLIDLDELSEAPEEEEEDKDAEQKDEKDRNFILKSKFVICSNFKQI